MPEIVTPHDGGSPITSYGLYWNQGSGTTYYPIVGTVSDNLNRIAVETSLTNGHAYKFKYMVKNIFGWSNDSSPISEIYSAKVPDAPLTP